VPHYPYVEFRNSQGKQAFQKDQFDSVEAMVLEIVRRLRTMGAKAYEDLKVEVKDEL